MPDVVQLGGLRTVVCAFGALVFGLGCAVSAPGPLVIAHRGASAEAPEHTLSAYDLALEMGADFIEQDLQMTRDGVLVVLHDETLDRTARGARERCSGHVREKTLAALESCDFGRWFDERSPGVAPRYTGQRIVTLDALFHRYGSDARYYIETKHPDHAPGMEEALVALLERHGLRSESGTGSRVILQSFHAESLRRLRALLHPEFPLVQLVDDELGGTYDEVLAAVADYADGVGPHFSQVDAEFMAAARHHELVVHPYTVNDPAEMTRLLDLGADGMFTDRPDVLLELLRSR